MLLATPGGLFALYLSAPPPDPAPSEVWLYSIVASVVTLGVVGMAVALACVVRQRRLRSLVLLQEIEEAETALAEGLAGDYAELGEQGAPAPLAGVLLADAAPPAASPGALLQDPHSSAPASAPPARRSYALKRL